METGKIRLLIVDDSSFMLRILRQIFGKDPQIEIVAEAKNGTQAIEYALKYKPDVITMDLKMPGLDGVEATRFILSQSDSPPSIVMVSAFTRDDAEETFECLRAGALDYVQKPTADHDAEKIGNEIVMKVKMAASARVRAHEKIHPKSGNPPSHAIRLPKIVVIGASTGGPPVIENIISGLPDHLEGAVFVAQHMPVYFTGQFAERLSRLSFLKVKEAEDGEIVVRNTIYICPGGSHVVIKPKGEDYFIELLPVETPAETLTPSIDTLMESIARSYHGDILAVQLTGMGNDGFNGAKAIKASGGYVIAQDPKSAIVDSMPSSVINSGLSDETLSPEQISEKIGEWCS